CCPSIRFPALRWSSSRYSSVSVRTSSGTPSPIPGTTPHWDFLRKTVRIPLFGSRPCYGIFEYASSVLGLLVILLWRLSWYRNESPIHPRTNRRLLANDRIALACAFAIALFAAPGSAQPDPAFLTKCPARSNP